MTSVLIDYTSRPFLVDRSSIYTGFANNSLHDNVTCLLLTTHVWEKGVVSVLAHNNVPMSLDHYMRLPSVLLYSGALHLLLIVACIATSLLLASMFH